MLVLLLAVSFLVAVAISHLVVRFFRQPLASVLRRIIDDEVSQAWLNYLVFAIYVVGVSGGARLGEMEKFIAPARWDKEVRAAELGWERWVLEIYRTAIETLQGIAWMLLIFFVVALLAVVIVRAVESRRTTSL